MVKYFFLEKKNLMVCWIKIEKEKTSDEEEEEDEVLDMSKVKKMKFIFI